MATFQKAVKTGAKLRLAIVGPPGAGKTYSALAIASGFDGRVAVIDSERGSASKYATEFDFDVLELESFHPQNYIDAIQAASAEGYAVLVIDSLSHAWNGKDGALELVDRAARKSGSGNNFSAWRDVTPLHNQLVDAIIGARCHIIATMRTKTEYVVEKDTRGKSVPRKVGLAPVQREGMEYEFDIVGDITHDHELMISKTRCSVLADSVIKRPGADLAKTLRAWLDGNDAPEIEEIERIGLQVHGAEWGDATRSQWVEWLTQGTTKSVGDLNRSELTRLVDAMRRKLRASEKEA